MIGKKEETNVHQDGTGQHRAVLRLWWGNGRNWMEEMVLYLQDVKCGGKMAGMDGGICLFRKKIGRAHV